MNLKQVIITSIIFLLLDSVYLTSFSGFFNNVVKGIQGSKIQFKMLGALLCYISLIFGLNYFIIDQKKSIMDAFLFGFVIYSVFETTSYAIFTNWPFSAVIIDSLWGGILYALTTYIYRKFGF